LTVHAPEGLSDYGSIIAVTHEMSISAVVRNIGTKPIKEIYLKEEIF
jgi:hypothetical protein